MASGRAKIYTEEKEEKEAVEKGKKEGRRESSQGLGSLMPGTHQQPQMPAGSEHLLGSRGAELWVQAAGQEKRQYKWEAKSGKERERES